MLGSDKPLHRCHGIHQLSGLVMHYAVAGNNIGFCVDLEGSIGQDDEFTGFLVTLFNGDAAHLWGIVDANALGHQLHGLFAVEQSHIIDGGILYIAVWSRFLGYGVRSQI